MNKTIDSSKINKYTIIGNIFNSSFKNLTFFKFTDNFTFEFLKFSLKKSLMRNNYVAEFLIDFYNLEIHCLLYKCIIIPNRLDVYLRTREECFDSEYIHNHTALRTSLDKALNNFTIIISGINHIPRTKLACFFV